jgi:Tol biopolymer transport system component
VAYLEQYDPGVWALYRVPALGGVPLRLVESVEGSEWSKGKDVSFTPDGGRVAFIRRVSPERTALYVGDLASREERQIIARSGALFRPVWIDGKTLLCHFKVPGYSTEIRLLEISLPSAVVREIQAPKTPLFIAQSMLPDRRHLIALAGRSLSALSFYLAGYPSMELAPITQGAAYWRSPSLTPDGRALVAVRVEENYNLWTGVDGDADGRQLTFDMDAMEGVHGMGVTPSGELVYTSRANGDHNHVWIASPDGRRLRQLTSGDEDEYWPVVSPSGETIFYGQRQTKDKRSMRIWRMDIDTGRSMQLTSGNWDMLPAVTADGRWIVYTDGGGAAPVIKKVSTSGGAAETIAPGILFAPAVSPDGKYVAGFHARTMLDARALVTIRLEDGRVVERLAAVSPPAKLCVRWTRDGRGMIVPVARDGADNLWLYPLGGGAPRQLTNFSSLEIGSFHPLPDGEHYAFSRGKVDSDVVMIADLLQ